MVDPDAGAPPLLRTLRTPSQGRSGAGGSDTGGARDRAGHANGHTNGIERPREWAQPTGTRTATRMVTRTEPAHPKPEEITITRRLYRSGESEYLMNGCGRPDCAIFRICSAAPGLARRATRLSLSRAASGQILSNKPGGSPRGNRGSGGQIGKYKTRKRLAEAKARKRAPESRRACSTSWKKSAAPGKFAKAAGIEGQALRRTAHGDGGASAQSRCRGPTADAGARSRQAGARFEPGLDAAFQGFLNPGADGASANTARRKEILLQEPKPS